MFKEAPGKSVHVLHNLFYLLLTNYGRTTLTKTLIIVNVVICRTAGVYRYSPFSYRCIHHHRTAPITPLHVENIQTGYTGRLMSSGFAMMHPEYVVIALSSKR